MNNTNEYENECIIYQNGNNIIKMKLINKVKNATQIVKQALLFDDEQTCYYKQTSDLDLNARMFLLSKDIYGIYLNNNIIGLIGIYIHNPVDKTRLELCCCLKNEYRNKKIGQKAVKKAIEFCKNKKGVRSIYVSVREDNIACQKLVSKLKFKEYPGYKDTDLSVTSNETKIKKKQYLLKLKDYHN